MAIGEQHVAAPLMHVLAPENTITRVNSADDIPVAGQDGLRVVVSAERAKRVTDIGVAQPVKRTHRRSSIAGTDQQCDVQKIVRKCLKMPIKTSRAQHQEFQRAVLIRTHLHWITAVVVVRECVKRQTDLFEIAGALSLARAQLAFGNDGQKQRCKDGDDRDDHEQLDQRESTPRRTMFKSRHGP